MKAKGTGDESGFEKSRAEWVTCGRHPIDFFDQHPAQWSFRARILSRFVAEKRGITLETSAFFPFYFGLTALHLAHVVIGSIILAVMAWATRTAPVRHFTLIESGSCFWHMVDLLWIVIFALLYLVE